MRASGGTSRTETEAWLELLEPVLPRPEGGSAPPEPGEFDVLFPPSSEDQDAR